MKRILPDLIAILLFVLISFAYFYPANIEGRVLVGHDNVAGIGAGQEQDEYLQRTGERTRWTNTVFGGMPTYQMAPSYDSTDALGFLEKAYHLFIPGTMWYVLVMLLGFYILLRAFDFKVWMAALGAILWAFSSYFFIIIGAGHIWKLVTLAYIPATIAGMVLVYRGKWLWGVVVTALFVALQIRANHVQMSYYFLFPMLFMAIAYGVEALRGGRLAQFIKGTGVLIVAALIGVSINISNLYHTYEYSKETMRGKPELVKDNASNQTSSGLERDYITQWSYGIGETWSLLVPNVKGGASVPLALNDKAMEKANPMYRNLYGQLGQYWGEQPGTSGPVYVGAFVMMLFVLGLLIVKGPMKWALLAATILSIMLSWGKNFMGLTDLFLDYVPMYDKFRAVSSILVIAEFTIPLLAMLALKEVVERVQGGRVKKTNEGEPEFSLLPSIYISAGVTAGFALLFAIVPTLFFSNYISTSEMAALKGGLPAEHVGAVISNLTEMRVSLFTADAWRSFFFIVGGTLVLLLFQARKISLQLMIAILAVLCLADMWPVNKRYLNDGMFKDQSARVADIRKTPTDETILQDKALDYRVLNLASNTFNENNTSYYHKSIGGYHAAKLRRYQEMIEEHIQHEMKAIFGEVSKSQGNMDNINGAQFPVVNMLNTRWFIFPMQGGATMPLYNPYALGNAWFVESVEYVNNANEEIAALHNVYPADVAVVDVRFKDVLKAPLAHKAPIGVVSDSLSADSVLALQRAARGTISLTSYEPNKLVYEVDAPSDGLVVFSEIYYPGWRSYVDGKEVEHGRANYILRAMNISAGKHIVEFTFDPQSLHVTEGIAYGALFILLVMVILALVLQSYNRKKM